MGVLGGRTNVRTDLSAVVRARGAFLVRWGGIKAEFDSGGFFLGRMCCVPWSVIQMRLSASCSLTPFALTPFAPDPVCP